LLNSQSLRELHDAPSPIVALFSSGIYRLMQVGDATTLGPNVVPHGYVVATESALVAAASRYPRQEGLVNAALLQVADHVWSLDEIVQLSR